MTKPIYPKQSIIVSDIDTLKVISDPLRLKILEFIRQANQNNELRTTKQLAQALDMTQPKLYYHIKQLEKHGFIQIADTKIVSGIVEKHYQVTAQSIQIDPTIFTVETAVDEQAQSILNMLKANFEITYQDVQSFLTCDESETADRLKGHHLYLSHELARLNLSQVEAFKDRLQALVDEFTQMSLPADDEPSAVYRFSATLHPTLRSDTNALDVTLVEANHPNPFDFRST